MNFIEATPISGRDRLTALEANAFAASAIAGDQTVVGGRVLFAALATPAAPTIVVTGGAAGNQAYKVVAKLGTGTTAASAAGSTSAGPTTLNATHYNTVSWLAVPGATSYDVYRTTGGAAQGKILSTVDATTLSVVDNGLVATVVTAPIFNTTGLLASQGFQRNVNLYAADGAVKAFGLALITKPSTPAVLTLAVPVAGDASVGGHDGCVLEIVDTIGAAHTVTTPASGFVGGLHIATFGATANNTLKLVAYNAIWYVLDLGGCVLS